MANIEERTELGGGLMFIGLALWVADLLVVFYLPALTKAGPHSMLLGIIGAIAVLGLCLIITGYALRRKSQVS